MHLNKIAPTIMVRVGKTLRLTRLRVGKTLRLTDADLLAPRFLLFKFIIGLRTIYWANSNTKDE